MYRYIKVKQAGSSTTSGAAAEMTTPISSYCDDAVTTQRFWRYDWAAWYRSRCRNDSKDFRRTILAADIAADAVTTAKILDGTILAADIATDAVTTVKIADANVTTAKIADANVTTAKIRCCYCNNSKDCKCRCYECKIR
jgi:hypothetical protein